VRAMGAQARQTACALDWGRIVEQVESVYLAAMMQVQPTPQIKWQPAMPLS
jgi:hypothetical protein